MKRFWQLVIMISFQLLLVHSNSMSIAQNSSLVEKAAEWLQGQQNEQTGLIRSYDMPGDCTAWTYDQAVGIIALLEAGNPNAAKRCANGMMEVARDNNQWVDGYDSISREEVAKPVAVGPNAWMGLALLRLYQVSGNSKYLAAAQDVANFILGLQRQDGCGEGSIPGGYDINGNLFLRQFQQIDRIVHMLGTG